MSHAISMIPNSYFKEPGLRDSLQPDDSTGRAHELMESASSPLFRALETRLERALVYCFETQDDRGAWEVQPDPRLFDTGFVAYALSSAPTRLVGTALGRARRWLDRSSPQDHDPLARLLDDTPRFILGKSGTVDLRSPTLYSKVFQRKALLLYTLALHAGMEVLSPLTVEDVRAKVRSIYERRNEIMLKQWSRVDLVSVHLLLEHMTPNPSTSISATDAVLYLASLQAEDGSFCHNPVSTAIAFLALSAVAPSSRTWRRCLQHLLDTQRSDGTWRFCTSGVWDTSLTIRTFCDHPFFRTRALEPAVNFLVSSQNDDGGWGFRTDLESDNDTTSCCLLALRDLLPNGHHSTKRAVEYLLARQRPDRLWNTWQSDDDHPVEDCVAHVVRALLPFAESYEIQLDTARAWLARRYRESVEWSTGWYRSLPYSVLEIGRCLVKDDPAARTAASALIRHQNTDGGWPAEPGGLSRASSTGLAIAALTDHFASSEPFIQSGIRYLFDTQRVDGTWRGHPELYGPRPLVYHLPTNTHAFASLGLMAARQKLTRRPAVVI